MQPQTTCALCRRPAPFRVIYRRGPYTMVRCPSCSLVFQDPRPDPRDLEGVYYFDADFVQRLEGELRPIVESRAREKLRLLGQSGIVAGGRTLDVGCSTGAWLEAAAAAGWEPIGVEIGDAAATVARVRGLEVHTGTLDEVAVELEGGFDLITFWDVLEHLPDPLGTLRMARSLLAPGGVVAMTFPNIGGWYPRLTYRLLARTTGVWEHPELPVHLFDFSPATARRLLIAAGLRATTVKTTQISWKFLATTTLHAQLGAAPRRRKVLMPAFAALRTIVYPAARIFDRGNAQFVLAGLEADVPGAIVSA